MGRFCTLCGRNRPNEHFGGKGERARVCRDCRRMPKEKQAALKQEDEISGFLKQSHISDRNVSRLRTLAQAENTRIADLAGVALEMALVKPYKRGRLKVLARQRRDLLVRLEETGLIWALHR